MTKGCAMTGAQRALLQALALAHGGVLQWPKKPFRDATRDALLEKKLIQYDLKYLTLPFAQISLTKKGWQIVFNEKMLTAEGKPCRSAP
jgi:hypothetical protein